MQRYFVSPLNLFWQITSAFSHWSPVSLPLLHSCFLFKSGLNVQGGPSATTPEQELRQSLLHYCQTTPFCQGCCLHSTWHLASGLFPQHSTFVCWISPGWLSLPVPHVGTWWQSSFCTRALLGPGHVSSSCWAGWCTSTQGLLPTFGFPGPHSHGHPAKAGWGRWQEDQGNKYGTRLGSQKEDRRDGWEGRYHASPTFRKAHKQGNSYWSVLLKKQLLSPNSSSLVKHLQFFCQVECREAENWQLAKKFVGHGGEVPRM